MHPAAAHNTTAFHCSRSVVSPVMQQLLGASPLTQSWMALHFVPQAVHSSRHSGPIAASSKHAAQSPGPAVLDASASVAGPLPSVVVASFEVPVLAPVADSPWLAEPVPVPAWVSLLEAPSAVHRPSSQTNAPVH